MNVIDLTEEVAQYMQDNWVCDRCGNVLSKNYTEVYTFFTNVPDEPTSIHHLCMNCHREYRSWFTEIHKQRYPAFYGSSYADNA